MSSKEKLIVNKLFSIASKQQKTLLALAQTAQGADPGVVQYLKGAWQTAGLNSGISIMSTPDVTFTPGKENNGDQIGETYTLTGEVPENNREKFDQTFKAQIKSQKPELDGKVSTIFKDPTTPVKSAGDNMDSKKVIERLVKIAERQQKIINKMAQEMGMAPEQLGGASGTWQDASAEVGPVVQQATKAVGAKGQYSVESAEFGKDSGTLKVKLKYPMAQLGGPEAKAVSDKVKAMLSGKTVAGGQVANVEVIGVAV